MLVGSMMMPDPIMLTITKVVRPMRLIFLFESAIQISFFHTCAKLSGVVTHAINCRQRKPQETHDMKHSFAKHVRREFYRTVWFYFLVVWPIFSILLFTIVLFGIIIGQLEGWGPFDGIYFGFVTGLTIGYGDLVPKTTLSRILSVALGFNGVLMTAIFAAISIRAIEETAKAAQSEE